MCAQVPLHITWTDKLDMWVAIIAHEVANALERTAAQNATPTEDDKVDKAHCGAILKCEQVSPTELSDQSRLGLRLQQTHFSQFPCCMRSRVITGEKSLGGIDQSINDATKQRKYRVPLAQSKMG